MTLDIVPSGIPSADILAKGHADVLITPYPPDGADIFQKRLLRDCQVCFFDASVRDPPLSKKAYLSSPHITLRFAPGEQAGLDQYLGKQGVRRNIELTVSSFSAVPTFMRGTKLLATLPSLLRLGLMRDLQSCAVPLDTGRFAMYLVWHRRSHQDVVHRWLREQIEAVASSLPSSPPNPRV